MMKLLWLLISCAALVGVLYVVSAIYRARQLLKERREVARSDAWERQMQKLENDPMHSDALRLDANMRTRRQMEK